MLTHGSAAHNELKFISFVLFHCYFTKFAESIFLPTMDAQVSTITIIVLSYFVFAKYCHSGAVITVVETSLHRNDVSRVITV